eukprot:15466963-Alexandrium_andersonii.AAC.1
MPLRALFGAVQRSPALFQRYFADPKRLKLPEAAPRPALGLVVVCCWSLVVKFRPSLMSTASPASGWSRSASRPA